jgi:hypothetical protein
MTIYHYIIIGVLFIIAIILYFVINRASAAVSNKRMILIFLSFSIAITIAGLIGFFDINDSGFLWFFILQLYFLGLGILIIYLFKRNFFGEFKYKIASEITLLLINSLFGVLGFSYLFDYCSYGDFGFSFSASILTFCIPYFFTLTFEALAAIPQEIFKVWYLNEDRDEPDFDKINVNRIYLLELELFKNVNKTELTNLKLKAPLEMKFGDWFQSIILNYNQRFEEDPIQYCYLDQSSMGWIFYTKPSFFKSKKYIDPDWSIEKNKLHEKLTIIAKRVHITYN